MNQCCLLLIIFDDFGQSEKEKTFSRKISDAILLERQTEKNTVKVWGKE